MTSPREHSAGRPIDVAETLQASFLRLITSYLTILRVNLQMTGLGPAVACLVGTRCAMSTSCLLISTPEAFKRLMHKDVVADADSRESISGRPIILTCIDYSFNAEFLRLHFQLRLTKFTKSLAN